MSVASKNLNIMNRRGTVRAKTLIVKSVTEVLRQLNTAFTFWSHIKKQQQHVIDKKKKSNDERE